MAQTECSKSSADHDIQVLRDHLDAPIEYNREDNGYFYNQQGWVRGGWIISLNPPLPSEGSEGLQGSR